MVRIGKAREGVGLWYDVLVSRLGLIAIIICATACNGEVISQQVEGLSPQEQVALDAWISRALPVLEAKCMMCHDGSMPNIGYIQGATNVEKRDTLVNYQPAIVNLGAPQSSRILTKGLHTGPALEATEATSILTWIRAEAVARPPVAPIRTMQMPMMLCTTGAPGTPDCPINTIDLSSLGPTGSTFEIVVSQLADSAYLTNMKFKAGADGLYLAHPLLESWPSGATEPIVDPIDRFFAYEINIAAATESVLGTGEATMQMWVASNPISVRFDVIEKKRP